MGLIVATVVFHGVNTARASATPAVTSYRSVAFRPQGGGWKLAGDGVVVPFGGAPDLAASPVPGATDLASSPDGKGYWVVTAGGRVRPFGDARYHGSAPGLLSRSGPVVGITASPRGSGYWLLDASGRLAAFGSARWVGSPYGRGVRVRAAAMTPTPDGRGYWTLTTAGNVYAFGDARWAGSPAARRLGGRYVGLIAASTERGYWVVSGSGVVRSYGSARRLVKPTTWVDAAVVAAAVDTPGYGLLTQTGAVLPWRRTSSRRVTSTSPGPAAPTAGDPSPVPQLPGGPMHLIFDDEFNGSALGSTWSTCWWYSPSPSGCSNGDGEGEWYTPANVTVANGELDLVAQHKRTEGVWMSSGAPRTYEYTSGMVTSRGKFSFTYGYVEWRAWLPAGQGLWPALWMLPANGQWPPEIDALEVIGNQPDIWTGTYHPPSPQPAQGFDATVPGLSSGWHTFGVDWEPGRLTWYLDGQQMATTTQNVTSDAMYLVMNLAVGGAWPGYPDASTPFPSALRIDYVRVWQH